MFSISCVSTDTKMPLKQMCSVLHSRSIVYFGSDEKTIDPPSEHSTDESSRDCSPGFPILRKLPTLMKRKNRLASDQVASSKRQDEEDDVGFRHDSKRWTFKDTVAAGIAANRKANKWANLKHYSSLFHLSIL